MSRGNVERMARTFAVALFLLFLGTGAFDLGRLVERQEMLAEAGAAAVQSLSAGSGFEEAIRTIEEKTGSLDFRGNAGRIILTEVALDERGRPVIARQEVRGMLAERSVTGRYEASEENPPAPPSDWAAPERETGYTVVEIFSRYDRPLAALAPGLVKKSVVLSSVTVH